MFDQCIFFNIQILVFPYIISCHKQMKISTRAVSSVGRASRLHREGQRFFSPVNLNLISNTTFLVTLVSDFVTKTKGKRHEYNKKARSEVAINSSYKRTP